MIPKMPLATLTLASDLGGIETDLARLTFAPGTLHPLLVSLAIIGK